MSRNVASGCDPCIVVFHDGLHPPTFVSNWRRRPGHVVRTGPAGLCFENRDYALAGNNMIVMNEETQEPKGPGSYVHAVSPPERQLSSSSALQ
jgi:hypothetical protein